MTPIVTRLCSLTFVLVCALGLTIKSPKETRLLNEATHRISIKSRNMDSLAMLANTYIAVDSLEEAILVFRQMGKVARESNTFMKAIEYHNKALELAETIGDEDGIILCLNQLGTDYRRIAAYEEATNYHYRALQRCGQYRGEPEFALKHKVISLNGIGNIYRKLNNLDEAESLFRQALVGETQLKSYLGMAINYANIGAILEARHQYDSAHVYYERSMEYNRLENSQLGISLCYISFGRLAEAKGDYTTALREYHAAYDIMDKTADRTQWLKACLSIVRVNIAKGDMNNALLYLGRAEKTALALNANDHLATVYDLKYRYFEKKGDFRQALNSYATAKRYADSTLNLTNVNHINDLRMFYETSKREAEISALKGEKRLTLWIGFSGGTILLLFAVTFFFFWRWTKGRKRIAEQEVKRQKQDQELIASQAMFDGELQERTRLARDLHDRMGGTLSALKLHLAEMTKNATPESASLTTCNKAMELLDESMREMRRIAHHLMPESLGREGLKTAISEFCKSIPNTSFAWYGSEERLDAKLELNVYRITYELINNAMKHAGASHIFVQIVCDANRISIAVKDDGRGFNTHEIAEGMGFSNIRSHVDSYNGFIDINSAKGEGTEINVELKIMN